MISLSLLAGLGASFFWALGSLLAHTPARHLGAFELTRTQLISSFLVLFVIVTAMGGWATVSWTQAPALAIASLVGVVLGNLAMMACLARGGPRRTQLLMASNVPIAACLGNALYGEVLSAGQLAGAALVLLGIVTAILRTGPTQSTANAKSDVVHGSFILMLAFGVAAAMCNAVGLVAMKPALIAGTDPLAATAIRTGGGALLISVLALWPSKLFEPKSPRTARIVLMAIAPGLLGYVVAVTLQLVALRTFGAGVAAVLSSAAPVLILPMIWIASRNRPPIGAWVGAGLVFAGVGLLVST
jgi:drug/metabolite transporter (DMT)-like permease